MVADSDFEFSAEWPPFDEIRPGHEILFKRAIPPAELEQGGPPLRYLQALARRAGCDSSAAERIKQYRVYWEGGQRLKKYGLDRTLLSGPTREEFLFLLERSASSGKKQKTRWATFERDNFVCTYCEGVDGKAGVEYLLRLEADHFFGRQESTPFATACACCNKLKLNQRYSSLAEARALLQPERVRVVAQYEHLAASGWTLRDSRRGGNVFARDGWTCGYCGLDARSDFIFWYTLQRDHFTPVHHGGGADTEYVTACPRCNQWKSKRQSKDLDDVRKVVAENKRAWVMIWEKLRRDGWRVTSLQEDERLLPGRVPN